MTQSKCTHPIYRTPEWMLEEGIMIDQYRNGIYDENHICIREPLDRCSICDEWIDRRIMTPEQLQTMKQQNECDHIIRLEEKHYGTNGITAYYASHIKKDWGGLIVNYCLSCGAPLTEDK